MKDGAAAAGTTTTPSTDRRSFQAWMNSLTWEELQQASMVYYCSNNNNINNLHHDDDTSLESMISNHVSPPTPIHPRAVNYPICRRSTATTDDGRYDEEWQRWKKQRRTHARLFRFAATTTPAAARGTNTTHRNNATASSSYSAVYTRGFIQRDGTRYALPPTRIQEEADWNFLERVCLCTPLDTTTDGGGVYLCLMKQNTTTQTATTATTCSSSWWHHLFRRVSRGNWLSSLSNTTTTTNHNRMLLFPAWFQPTERWFTLSMYIAARMEQALIQSYLRSKTTATTTAPNSKKTTTTMTTCWYRPESPIVQQMNNQNNLGWLYQSTLQAILRKHVTQMIAANDCAIRDSLLFLLLSELSQDDAAASSTAVMSSFSSWCPCLNVIQFWICPLLQVGSARDAFRAVVREICQIHLARQLEQELLQQETMTLPSLNRNTATSKAKHRKKQNKKKSGKRGPSGGTSSSAVSNFASSKSRLCKWDEEEVEEEEVPKQQEFTAEIVPPLDQEETSGRQPVLLFPPKNPDISDRVRNQNIVNVLSVLDDVIHTVFERVGLQDSGSTTAATTASATKDQQQDEDDGGGEWHTTTMQPHSHSRHSLRPSSPSSSSKKSLHHKTKKLYRKQQPNVVITLNKPAAAAAAAGSKTTKPKTLPAQQQQQHQQQPLHHSLYTPPSMLTAPPPAAAMLEQSQDATFPMHRPNDSPWFQDPTTMTEFGRSSPGPPLNITTTSSSSFLGGADDDPPQTTTIATTTTPSMVAARTSGGAAFDIFASRPYGNLVGGFFLRPESIDFAWDTHDFAFDQWSSGSCQREQSIMHDLFVSQERREQEMASSTIASIASSGPDTAAGPDDLVGVDDLASVEPEFPGEHTSPQLPPPPLDTEQQQQQHPTRDSTILPPDETFVVTTGTTATTTMNHQQHHAILVSQINTDTENLQQNKPQELSETSPVMVRSVAQISSVVTPPLLLVKEQPPPTPESTRTPTKVEIVIPNHNNEGEPPGGDLGDLSDDEEIKPLLVVPTIDVVAQQDSGDDRVVAAAAAANASSSSTPPLFSDSQSFTSSPKPPTILAPAVLPSPPILVSLADLQGMRRADSGVAGSNGGDNQTTTSSAGDVKSSSSLPAASGRMGISPLHMSRPRMVTSLSRENLRSHGLTDERAQRKSSSNIMLGEREFGESFSAGGSKQQQQQQQQVRSASVSRYSTIKARDDNDIKNRFGARRRSDALETYRAVASRTLVKSRDDHDVIRFTRATPPRVGSHRTAAGGNKRSDVKSSQFPFGVGGVGGGVAAYMASTTPDAVCARSEIGNDDYMQTWHDSRRNTGSNVGDEGDNNTTTKDGSTTITSALSHRETEENLVEERNTYRDLCLTLGAEVAKLRNLLASQKNNFLMAPPPSPQPLDPFSLHHPHQHAHHAMYGGAASKYFDHPASLSHLVNTAARSQTLAAMSDAGHFESMTSEDDYAVGGGGGKVHQRQVSSGATAASDASVEHSTHHLNVTVGVPLNPEKHQSTIPLSGVQSRLSVDINHFVQMTSSQLRKQEARRAKAVERMTRLVTALWPRAQIKLYGSHVTGLSLPTSDVDFVICLPAVQKDAPADAPGVLEGRNAINETSQKMLARKLKSESWIDPRSMKLIERTVVPVIKVATKDTKAKTLQLDITFDAPSHHGLEAVSLVNHLLEEYPMIRPLVLVVKQFLLDRGLLTGYTGGLSSYCLFLMTARYLQEQVASWADSGALLMGFLDFYGNHFDPRTTGISVRLSQYFARANYPMAAGPSPQPQMMWNAAAAAAAPTYGKTETVGGQQQQQFRGKVYVRRNSFSDKGNVDGLRGATTGAGRSGTGRSVAGGPFAASRSNGPGPHSSSDGAGDSINHHPSQQQQQQHHPSSSVGHSSSSVPHHHHHVMDGSSPDHGMPYTFDPLFVEDPLSVGNNVGRNTFRIFQVLRAFSDAHRALVASLEWDMQSSVGEDVTEYPLLKCLLQSEDVVYDL